MSDLIKMLRYRRPEGNKTQSAFCRDWIAPHMGKPDMAGNYSLRIGDSPLMFTAHHDTVHNQGGMQKVSIRDGMAYAPNSNCLGADCTTGVWLILEMIKARVPGFYVIFAGEEIGCVGSSWFADARRDDVAEIGACISFDRRGTDSIITHQCGARTASDDFAHSLASALAMDMRPDSGGAYTDSNEFAHIIPECTNLSVGYYSQHSRNETQDIAFAMQLRDSLICADWDKVRIARNPGEYDFASNHWRDSLGYDYEAREMSLVEMVETYPDAVADLLESYGIDAKSLAREIGLDRDWI